MTNKLKEIDKKNLTYYFFGDIINIKNLNPNKIKINQNLYKSVLIYYIGYETIKSYIKLLVQILYTLLSMK